MKANSKKPFVKEAQKGKAYDAVISEAGRASYG